MRRIHRSRVCDFGMGNKESRPDEEGEGGEKKQGTKSKHPAYFVTPVCDLDHIRTTNAVVVLRLEPEGKSSQELLNTLRRTTRGFFGFPLIFAALVLYSPSSKVCTALRSLRNIPPLLTISNAQERLAAFPYHKILCWGHNFQSFQFRYYTKDDELRLASVGTQEGEEMEKALLERVQSLMLRMGSVGITDDEFSEIKSVIREDPDEALRSIKQVSLSRLFDVKQAVEVVRLMEEVSPFDKVRVSC